MKSTSGAIGLMVALTMALGGCQGAHWANFLTLGVTASLFFGTLNLGRRPRADARAATTATTASGSRIAPR
jgi:hypothetical protein